MENDRSEVIQLKNKIENYFEKGKIPPSEKNLYTKFFTLYLYLKKENFLQINDKESCISYYAESEGLLKELKNIGILLETLSPELFFETFKKNHDEIDLFINKSKHERIELVRLFFNNDLFQFEYKQHKAEFLAFKAQMDRYHTINDSGLKKNYLNIIALRLDPVVGFYRKVHTLHIKSKEVQEFL